MGFWDNPFGGLFDFNGDGREDLGEQWVALNIFRQCAESEEDDDIHSSCIYSGDTHSDDGDVIDWREFCEDGSEFGIDPYDYDTEEEYNEALEEARENAALRPMAVHVSIECPLFDKLDEINERNYPNKRRYNAACTLENEFFWYSDEEEAKIQKECCRFIVEHADDITAANYLSWDSGFLYAQAIKDNFELPISLPDEDEYQECEFAVILCKIAKHNIPLSFEIWEWSLETFLPYEQYDTQARVALINYVIDELYSYPNNYRTELVKYMDKHSRLMEKIIDEKNEMADDLDALIATALQDGNTNIALTLFKGGLKQAGSDWKKINSITDGTISWCKNYDELESAEYFKLNMLPLVKSINIGMVQDEIEEWEKELDEYISQVEDECEQYAYTRKNAWRKNVPDGSKYCVDPCDYDSEQEYIEALNEEIKNYNDEWCEDEDADFAEGELEIQEECQSHHEALQNEIYQKEREKQEKEKQRLQQQQEREQLQLQQRALEQRIEKEKAILDDTVYTFCGVTFPYSLQPYHYRTEDSTIKVGDDVVVPVGNKEAVGKVVSVGQYLRIAAPYPVDKTKSIIRKNTDDLDNK